MSIVNDFHRPAGNAGKESRSLFGGLHQAAQRLADMRRGGSAFKTMDLVNVLLCQAARTRRAAMPHVKLRIRSDKANGVSAVRIRIS